MCCAEIIIEKPYSRALKGHLTHTVSFPYIFPQLTLQATRGWGNCGRWEEDTWRRFSVCVLNRNTTFLLWFTLTALIASFLVTAKKKNLDGLKLSSYGGPQAKSKHQSYHIALYWINVQYGKRSHNWPTRRNGQKQSDKKAFSFHFIHYQHIFLHRWLLLRPADTEQKYHIEVTL